MTSPDSRRERASHGTSRPGPPSLSDWFSQRLMLVSAVAVLALVVWFAIDALLLLFGGILWGVFLRALAVQVNRYTNVPIKWSLALVLLSCVIMLAIGGWLLGQELADQLGRLGKQIQLALEDVAAFLRESDFGRQALNSLALERGFLFEGNPLLRATGVLSTAVGAISTLLIVTAIGVYGALDPGLYQRGFLHLVPMDRRERAEEVIGAVGTTMQWWLLGQFANMTIIGIATTVGLWLLGIPFALALGLLAFALDFINYIGPILAAIPAILVALTIGPMEAVYVAILYMFVQALESYLVSPLIMQHAVEVPPALIISLQLVLGVVIGSLGLVFAGPLAAVGLLLVKMLYVQDTLHDDIDIPAANEARLENARHVPD